MLQSILQRPTEANLPFSADLKTSPKRSYDPSNPGEVCRGLLRYCQSLFRTPKIRFAKPPEYIPDGWETHTYLFQLRGSINQEAYLKPLVIRIYSSRQGLPRARHEFAVQRFLYSRNFPVAQALSLEEKCAYFGGPFLIMEQIPGRTLVQFLSYHPLFIWPMAYQMAKAHINLHELSPDAFPGTKESFLSRRLREIENLIEHHHLLGLEAGLDWLKRHRPPEPEKPSILHLDFHPLNVMRLPGGGLIVLDWPEADLGDFHADLGTTAVLMDCCPVGDMSLFDQLVLPIGRTLFPFFYWYEYKKRRPVDEDRLNYYKALATLRRLAGYGRWLDASPLATGSKPSSIRFLCPHHLKVLQSYFCKATGVRLTL
jgi:aminoglycoside phosphotransferase (APT) family kinase protein